MRCGERCLLPTTCLVQRTEVRTLSLFGIKRQSKHSRCMEILKYGGLCRKTILCVFLCLTLPPRTRVCLELCFVVNDSCLGQLENFSFGFSYGCSQTLCRIMFFVSSRSKDQYIIVLQGCAFVPHKSCKTKRSMISGDVYL